jgi:multiple sugar transport system ATP-binding protein
VARMTIDGVSKEYEPGAPAVDSVQLDVEDGELLVLVGPSGCGKSTLLRMVAGLEEVTSGRVLIGGRDVTYQQPKDRDLAMVFQSYALYPHMTVGKNIGYPLKVAKVPKADRERKVAEVAAMLHLDGVLDRRPSQLSGGQRQRVAMGRALIREPQAFLMDEPLSNLDAKLRIEMRAEISRLQRRLGVTSLYVTHDQVEAMTMGSRVAVLDHGRLQQVDTPQRVYDRPANLFVATFIGSPSMNLLTGTVRRGHDGSSDHDSGPERAAGTGHDSWCIDLGGQCLDLDDRTAAAFTGLDQRVGRDVVVGVRPEALTDAAGADDRSGLTLDAQVDLVESLGAELMVHVDPAGARTHESGSGRTVARFSPRSRCVAGDTVRLVVDPAGLHLFDPESGGALRADGFSGASVSSTPAAPVAAIASSPAPTTT